MAAELRRIYPIDRVPGVWATDADVHRTVHDFTLDFFRTDPATPPPGKAVLVVRVALSPWGTQQFLDSLGTQWNEYLRGMLPPEVTDGQE